jgi:cytidine deaminase
MAKTSDLSKLDRGTMELLIAAAEAREHAYVPYSHFAVGAALRTRDGKIYTGCNIENASYPAGNCAERTAFFKAVSEGERNFQAIAIAGGAEGSNALVSCPPCGMCRQVMSEFCTGEFVIYYSGGAGSIVKRTLAELLPDHFTL